MTLRNLTFDILAQDRTDRAFRSVRSNLGQTDRAAERLERRMSRAGRTLAAGIAGFVSIQGIRRLNSATQEAVNTLDSIDKTASKIGLSTDALQELRVAAELSGVEVRTFDTAFQRFTRRTAEAAEGTGEAKDALNELGIALRDSQGQLRPTEDLFSDVADALAGIEDPATRVRLAFKLFDSEGVAVVNMLQEGGAALDSMRQKARELGVVIDDDLIKKTVESKDELTLMQRVIDAELTVALANLAPVLVDISGLFADAARAAGEAHGTFSRFFGQFAEKAELGLINNLVSARKELEGLKSDMQREMDPATRSTEMEVQINFAQNRASIEGRDFDEANFVMEKFVERREELVQRVAKLQEEFDSTRMSAPPDVPDRPKIDFDRDRSATLGGGGGGGASRAGTAEINERADAVERLTERIREQIREEQLRADVLGLTEAAAARLTDQRELDQAIQEAGNDATAKEIEQARELAARLDTVRSARLADEEAMRAQEEATRDQEDAQRALAGSIDRVADTLIRAIDRGASFLEVLSAIAQQILTMPSIQDELFGVTARGGGSGGGGLVGDLVSGIGNLIGGGTPTISAAPHLGLAGSFNEGGSFTVGGRGGVDNNLVAFRASRGEQVDITPARETSRTAERSVTINQTINVPDARGMREAGGNIARRTAQEVRRGQGYT